MIKAIKKSLGIVFYLTNISTILAPALTTSRENYPTDQLGFKELFTIHISQTHLTVYYCVTSLILVVDLRSQIFPFFHQHDLWVGNIQIEDNRRIDAVFIFKVDTRLQNHCTVHDKLHKEMTKIANVGRYTKE